MMVELGENKGDERRKQVIMYNLEIMYAKCRRERVMIHKKIGKDKSGVPEVM
jgi:hypothetical protein